MFESIFSRSLNILDYQNQKKNKYISSSCLMLFNNFFIKEHCKKICRRLYIYASINFVENSFFKEKEFLLRFVRLEADL